MQYQCSVLIVFSSGSVYLWSSRHLDYRGGTDLEPKTLNSLPRVLREVSRVQARGLSSVPSVALVSSAMRDLCSILAVPITSPICEQCEFITQRGGRCGDGLRQPRARPQLLAYRRCRGRQSLRQRRAPSCALATATTERAQPWFTAAPSTMSRRLTGQRASTPCTSQDTLRMRRGATAVLQNSSRWLSSQVPRRTSPTGRSAISESTQAARPSPGRSRRSSWPRTRRYRRSRNR